MGANRTPTVSVILPTYYRNEQLLEALESVEHQTYPNVECIVVDDSGERFAEDVVDESWVKYVAHEENKGAPAARRTGLDVATGEYVQLLDDDDTLHPRKFEAQVDVLQQPEVGVAYCGVEMGDGQVALPTEEQLESVRERALTFSLWPCYTCTMLIERELLLDIDQFVQYEGNQDGAIIIDLAHATEFDAVFEPLVRKNDTLGSLGSSDSAVRAHFEIIDGKRQLYEDAGEDVLQQALANAYYFKGFALIRSSFWSGGACLAFLRAAVYDPDLHHVIVFLASLFGQPGMSVGRAGKRLLS